MKVIGGAITFAAFVGTLPAAHAEPVVKVAEIQTDSSCTIFESYWGLWLVEECRENFPDLKARLQSAIAESGKLALSTTSGGRDIPAPGFIVSGRISGLGMTRSKNSARDYCVGLTTVHAEFDLRVRDTAGRVVHAATISKNVELGSNIVAGAGDCSTNTPVRVSYDTLQREIALATARSVSFKLVPLHVTELQGRRVGFNYGSPLLVLGTVVQVDSTSGYPAKYRVTSAIGETAWAEPIGPAADLQIGAHASVIESDDPAANGRRYDRVELPL